MNMSTQNCGKTKCGQKMRAGERKKRVKEREREREGKRKGERERERARKRGREGGIKWNKIAVSFLIFECYY